MRSAYLRVRTEFGKGDTLRLQIMVAATLAITLIAASCGGGDQGDGTTGVATLIGVDSPETDTLIGAAATPEATTSESEAGTIPAATAG